MKNVFDWLKKPQNVLMVISVITAFLSGISEGYQKALELTSQKETK